MGRLIGPPLSESDKNWILRQKIFFCATAPNSTANRVNLSPKSASEFRVINSTTVCWLDLSGSGCETAAHLYENGRLTLLFVAFEGSPKIVRLYGTGEIVMPTSIGQSKFCTELTALYKENLPGGGNYHPGFRSFVLLHVNRISQSCGYSIPFLEYKSDRSTLLEFSEKRGPKGMVEYRALKNSFSIDGLYSIGQEEQGRVPSSCELKDGYVLATYGSDKLMINQLYVYLRMLYCKHGGFSFNVRDFAFFCFGILLYRLLAWASVQ